MKKASFSNNSGFSLPKVLEDCGRKQTTDLNFTIEILGIGSSAPHRRLRCSPIEPFAEKSHGWRLGFGNFRDATHFFHELLAPPHVAHVSPTILGFTEIYGTLDLFLDNREHLIRII